MRRGLFRSTLALARRMESSVTKDPFPPEAQSVLNQAAIANGFTSPYWFTLAQCKRSLNGRLVHDARPTRITLAVERVIPFQSLPLHLQELILDQHPPYFASGVGILSHRYKWNAVLAKRLVRQLNPTSEDRAFYVDLVFATSVLKVTPEPEDCIDITAQSTVFVYNGDQLVDPFKAIPMQGVALNALNGRRIPQPGHDILLATGILRGYTSPFWVSQAQLAKFHHIKLTSDGSKAGVEVPTMVGRVVRLSDLLHLATTTTAVSSSSLASTSSIARLQRMQTVCYALLRELCATTALWGSDITPEAVVTAPGNNNNNTVAAATAPATAAVETSPHGGAEVDLALLVSAVRKGLEVAPFFVLFGANGWELIRGHAVVQAMLNLPSLKTTTTAVSTPATPQIMSSSAPPSSKQEKLFALFAVTSSSVVDRCVFVNIDDIQTRRPDLAAEFAEILTFMEGEPVDSAQCGTADGTIKTLPSLPTEATSATSNVNVTLLPSFDLVTVTKRKFFNASSFEEPHHIIPSARPIAIVNGKLAGRRTEAFLRHHALQHKFSSPVWVTKRGASQLGVTIPSNAVGMAPPSESEFAIDEEYYSLHDLEDQDSLLKVHPLSQQQQARGLKRHMILRGGAWRMVLGRKRIDALTLGLERSRQNIRDHTVVDDKTNSGTTTATQPVPKFWVSSSEVLMSGLRVKDGALPVRTSPTAARSMNDGQLTNENKEQQGGGTGLPLKHNKKTIMKQSSIAERGALDDDVDADDDADDVDDQSPDRRMIFNSQQTSDPVKTIALTYYYARPQVMKS